MMTYLNEIDTYLKCTLQKGFVIWIRINNVTASHSTFSINNAKYMTTILKGDKMLTETLVDEKDIANNSVSLSQCTKFCKEHSLVISNLRLEIRSSRSSTFTSYAQGELSAVIPRQTSKCLLSGWKWYRGIKKWKQLSYCQAFEENRNEKGSYLRLRREVN